MTGGLFSGVIARWFPPTGLKTLEILKQFYKVSNYGRCAFSSCSFLNAVSKQARETNSAVCVLLI